MKSILTGGRRVLAATLLAALANATQAEQIGEVTTTFK